FLASPLQYYGPTHRMVEFATGAARIQQCLLQLEIPSRRAVGVVDQHQVWVVTETFALHFHGATVLFHELTKNILQQRGPERQPAKDVPAGDYINPAMAAGDGCDRGQAREPVLPCPDGLE